MQDLVIYNTLHRKKELFQPIAAPHVGMYVCGPTVYGDPHLGHARPAITFDILFRYLRHIGYKVRYVRNITDVGHLEHDADEGDDKIEKKARLEQLEPMEIAQHYTNRYHDAMRALKAELEKDRAAQEPLEKKAREARLAMEEKIEAQQALIDQMKYDKETIDRKQDESRAASERITRMLQHSGLRNLPVQGSGAMIWPLAGSITSDFGWRTHPITGAQRFHSGIDIGGDYGDPIYAAQAGTVEYAGWISGYGNAVIINHGGGISTLYGHCQSLDVSTGQSVAQGELIAACGSTGNSTGPHCHFEVRVNGEPVNPLAYL